MADRAAREEALDAGGPLVVGIGNPLRGDDGAGLEVARLIGARGMGLEAIALQREPITLLELLPGRRHAILIDAIPGTEPGRIHRFDAARPLPAELRPQHSTHLLGVGEVVELGRELGLLSERLELIGIVGTRFAMGAPMSAPVRGAVEAVASLVVAEHGVGEGVASNAAQ